MKTLGNIIWVIHHLGHIRRLAHSLGVFHRRTDTDDNHHRHPIRKYALPTCKAGSFTFWERGCIAREQERETWHLSSKDYMKKTSQAIYC